ncbi:MAG: PH domain-containing protein [Chloroflexia bacterium]
MDIAQHNLHRDLQPDELVLWTGRPERGAYLSRECLPSCVGIAVLVQAMIWSALLFNVIRELVLGVLGGTYDVSSPAGTFGVGVVTVALGAVLFGLYLVIGRYLLGYVRWRNTWYVLTEDRLMIYTGLLGPALRSVPLPRIRSARVRPGGPKVGDVVLRLYQPETFSRPRRLWASRLDPELIGVESAHEVRLLLSRAARRSLARLGAAK